MTGSCRPTRTIADVAVINATSLGVLDDETVASFVRPLQRQVSEHFASFWGADAQLTFAPRGSKPDADAWWLVIVDTSEQADALGYHDLTPAGLPLGKVFAAPDRNFNTAVSKSASHELLEMLADPAINRAACRRDDAGNMQLYAYEACDPCDDNSYAYEIDGVLVSDFVLPSWFGGLESTRYDYCGHVKEPLAILPGGCITTWSSETGWTELAACDAGGDHPARPCSGTRRERRRIDRRRWRHATIWT